MPGPGRGNSAPAGEPALAACRHDLVVPKLDVRFAVEEHYTKLESACVGPDPLTSLAFLSKLIELMASHVEDGEELIEADVAIVGFGFARLATLMHPVRTGTPRTGGWADDPADFAPGRGLTADRDHQVAESFYALGGLLTGQLWETVAVPELCRQAALIAARLSLR